MLSHRADSQSSAACRLGLLFPTVLPSWTCTTLNEGFSLCLFSVVGGKSAGVSKELCGDLLFSLSFAQHL